MARAEIVVIQEMQCERVSDVTADSLPLLASAAQSVGTTHRPDYSLSLTAGSFHLISRELLKQQNGLWGRKQIGDFF
jgi:hypothetical protein